MTRNADFKRRVRERMARTGESYGAARAQLLPRARTLHVTNGDSTVATLGLDALPWRDALHEGPVVKDGRARRAEFLGVDEAELERRDRRLDDHDGDFLLWFEADLYDQLQIAEILARLRGSIPRGSRWSRSASTSGSRTSAASASSPLSSCTRWRRCRSPTTRCGWACRPGTR